jgi:hypothetical protein
MREVEIGASVMRRARAHFRNASILGVLDN